MTAPIRIRDATPADLPALMRIYFDAVHGLTDAHYDAAQQQAWAPESLRHDEAHWRQRLGGREVVIGVCADEPAGFCAFEVSGYVDLLFTHPDHARRGVARRLLEEAEARMRRAGTLQARAGASRISRPLFERLGYLAYGEETTEVRGIRLPHTNMRKFL
ncbi:MAG: GNAT family N-acetyltransferase [Planctomycetota bacterium]